MDAVELARKLQEEATCSICLDYFTDPVMTACGHNFCRECIQMTWEKGKGKKGRRKRRGSFPCPECREMSPQRNLRPNRLLTKVAEMVRQHPGLQNGDLCKKHQELLKLFCAEDQSPICVVCRESRDHRLHTVFPIEEAIQEYKLKLEENMKHLRDEMMKNEKLQIKEVQILKEWQEKVKNRRECILREFEKMNLFLAEEEQRLLQTLKKEEEETSEKLQENKAVLDQQSRSLERLLLELEDTNEHSALQMLQDMNEPFIRYVDPGVSLEAVNGEMEGELVEPEGATRPVSTGGKQPEDAVPRGHSHRAKNSVQGSRANRNVQKFPRIWSLARALPYGTHESILGAHPPTFHPTRPHFPTALTAVDVVPDVDTASPQLLLYESRQRCYLSSPVDSTLLSRDRFLAYPCVVGQKTFSSGKHYWEVGVNLMGDTLWALGVCRDNVNRKDRVPKSPENGFWVVQLSKGEKYMPAISASAPFTLTEPPRHVGVFLDCEAGDISFYSVHDGSHLHTYSQAAFSGPVQPFFCLGAPKSGQMVISTVTVWVKG